MTHSSTADLEREAEQRRADMTETAERLRAKLTPGQLLDEAVHTFRGGDWSAAATNLKTQIRDNPLALGLMGVGIACLAAGVPQPSRSISARRGPSATERVSASSREALDNAGSAISDGLGSGASVLSDLARDTGARTKDAAHKVESEMTDLLQREPLVLGAVGLAIGAAIGALLPESKFEEKHLGPYEDRIKQAGAEAARSAVGKAGDVAAAAGQAALDEADQRGRVSGQEAPEMAQSAGAVADRALGEAEDSMSGGQPPAGHATTGSHR
ncbi:MAG: DUF3618 domain-containing protein [Aquamicrobium sp.]|nr:DUF3618 domain-containing protein [Aquamicrobium sp.]